MSQPRPQLKTFMPHTTYCMLIFFSKLIGPVIIFQIEPRLRLAKELH